MGDGESLYLALTTLRNLRRVATDQINVLLNDPILINHLAKHKPQVPRKCVSSTYI